MANSWEIIRNKLISLRGSHGAVAEFCRQAGVHRGTVETWLAGAAVPGIDKLDRIAAALGMEAWEPIKPDGAQPTPPRLSPTVEALTKVIEQQEARLRELEGKSL